MKIRFAVAVAVVGGLVVPAASAAPADTKITGGGKTAAGATIAFVAQGTAGSAKGQVQYNDHQGNKRHATVTCVTTGPVDTNGDDAGGEATGFEIAGITRDGVVVNVKGIDGGKTSEGKGVDLITFDDASNDSSCDLQPANAYENLGTLAHGNVTNHGPSPSAGKKQRRTELRAAKATARAAHFRAGVSSLSATSLL